MMFGFGPLRPWVCPACGWGALGLAVWWWCCLPVLVRCGCPAGLSIPVSLPVPVSFSSPYHPTPQPTLDDLGLLTLVHSVDRLPSANCC